MKEQEFIKPRPLSAYNVIDTQYQRDTPKSPQGGLKTLIIMKEPDKNIYFKAKPGVMEEDLAVKTAKMKKY